MREIGGAFDQIFDVAGKTSPAEIPAAAAQAGKVEAQRRDPFRRQRPGHFHRRAALPGAGEAVRIQRCTADDAFRQFERAGQRVSAGAGNGDGFGGHGFTRSYGA